MRPLLEQIDSSIKDELLRVGAHKSLGESSILFSEGDSAEYLPIILSGKVKMVRFPEPGKEVIIGVFSDGEMFAVPAAFDGQTFPSTAVAMTDSELLLVRRTEFLGLLSRFPALSMAVIEWMCAVLREKTAVIQNLATSSPEQRVANVLLRIADREAGSYPLRITLRRQDIAEMSGLTTETVIRCVKRMCDKGLLEIDRGKIVIPEREPLALFAK